GVESGLLDGQRDLRQVRQRRRAERRSRSFIVEGAHVRAAALHVSGFSRGRQIPVEPDALVSHRAVSSRAVNYAGPVGTLSARRAPAKSSVIQETSSVTRGKTA